MMNHKTAMGYTCMLIPTLLKSTLEYMMRYNVSALHAFTVIVNKLYDYSKGNNITTAARQDYTERLFMLISENYLNLSDSELNGAYRYFGGISISVDPKIDDVEKQLKAEIAEQNAYMQKLIDNTKEQRNLIAHSQFILSDEVLQYIEYWKASNENEEYLLYNNLFYLGYIAGKRSERVRRR